MDEYVFRASPLRNIAVTASYFQPGVVWELRTAVDIMASSQLGADLSDGEVEAAMAFLESLTGTVLEAVYPLLPAETASKPRPTGEVAPQQ